MKQLALVLLVAGIAALAIGCGSGIQAHVGHDQVPSVVPTVPQQTTVNQLVCEGDETEARRYISGRGGLPETQTEMIEVAKTEAIKAGPVKCPCFKNACAAGPQ
jgi:hypothetical protein